MLGSLEREPDPLPRQSEGKSEKEGEEDKEARK